MNVHQGRQETTLRLCVPWGSCRSFCKFSPWAFIESTWHFHSIYSDRTVCWAACWVVPPPLGRTNQWHLFEAISHFNSHHYYLLCIPSKRQTDCEHMFIRGKWWTYCTGMLLLKTAAIIIDHSGLTVIQCPVWYTRKTKCINRMEIYSRFQWTTAAESFDPFISMATLFRVTIDLNCSNSPQIKIKPER